MARLPNDYLVKVDVASMKVALELRSPFLDSDLTALASSLDPRLKVKGGVQKYLKEVSLFNQVFVKAADGKQTVEQYVKSTNTVVKGFTMFTVGEGIEKKQEDFAAEVAATLAAAKGQ